MHPFSALNSWDMLLYVCENKKNTLLHWKILEAIRVKAHDLQLSRTDLYMNFH